MSALREVETSAARAPDESFDDFFRREYPRTVRLAWLLTRSEQAAEDIAQEAMVAVHTKFDVLDEPAPYLTRVVANRCRTWHRQSASHLRLVKTLAQHPESAASPADDYLLDAVHRLPYRQRVVVVARYWGGWSESEIAAALQCRPGTIKSLASRAMTRLRKELDQ